MFNGIDVSSYQGDIDFEKLNVDFVIIRAGWGQKTLDKKFRRNIEACNKKNIPCGVYWFSYAYTAEMAKIEAKSCLAAISPYRITYPVCFDFEYDSVSYAAKHGVNVTKKLASDISIAFLREIEMAGYWPMNYTNLDFYNRYFDDRVKKYDLWAARYTQKEKDIVNGAGLWQYSSTGRVDGINGNVDLDKSFKDYPALIKIKGHTTAAEKPKDAPELNVSKDAYKIPDIYRSVFDAGYYYNRYQDLRDAFGPKATSQQLFEHFVTYGMREGRNACFGFDVKKYREKMSDLNEIYGDDWQAYFLHYMLVGKQEIAEGKRSSF